jgi:hypothetical protein
MIDAQRLSDRLWTYRRNRIDLSSWDLTGRHLTRLVGSTPWFEPWTDINVSKSGPTPPSPLGNGLQADSSGRLWLYVATGNDPWTPGGRGADRTYAQIYDTRIIVIDPVRATIVATKRFDEAVLPVSGCLCAAKYIERSDGRFDIQIVQLTLR